MSNANGIEEAKRFLDPMMFNISVEVQTAIRGLIAQCEALSAERNAQKRRADFNEDRCRDKDADWMAHDAALVERTRERDEARAECAALVDRLTAAERQCESLQKQRTRDADLLAAQSHQLEAVRVALEVPPTVCSGEYDDIPDSKLCLRAGTHICGKVHG